MNIDVAIKERKTVRKINDNPVDRETIIEILEIARNAPSVHNIQPWSFIIIDENVKNIWDIIDDGTKNAGLKNAWKKVRNAKTLIAVCSKMPKDTSNAVEVEMYFESMGAVIQNVLLLAHARDLGTCWMGGTIKKIEPELKHYLKIPEELRLITLISFGHFDKESVTGKPKRAVEEIAFNNFYNNKINS